MSFSWKDSGELLNRCKSTVKLLSSSSYLTEKKEEYLNLENNIRSWPTPTSRKDSNVVSTFALLLAIRYVVRLKKIMDGNLVNRLDCCEKLQVVPTDIK